VSGADPGDLVLRARWVIPVASPPLDGGWVRIRRGRIVGLGGAGDGPGPRPERVLDCGDAVILPGLVNAHTHLEFSDAVTPIEAAGGLADWIGRVVELRRARAAGPGADLRGTATRAGLVESAAHGVTAIGEISTGLPPGGYPARGPRLRVFREALGLSPAAAAAAASVARRDVADLQAAGVAAGFSPHAPYSVAAPLGGRLLAIARDHGLPVAMHLAESEDEEALLARGAGPFRDLLESLGAWDAARPPRLLPAAEWISRLARPPRGIVVHATHLGRDADAVARLARHRDRLCVAICPRTTRAISGVLPPLALLRAAGVRVCLGTDGRGSNPDLSILAECRTLVDAGLASPTDALAMATRDGAWALGFDRRCGSLTPGRAADLLVLRPTRPHADPAEAALDPATQITAVLRSGHLIAGQTQ